MGRRPGDIDKFRLLQGLSVKALKVWGEILDTGSEQAKVAVARDVMARAMPVPKANPAAVAAAAALGAAGGAHLAALLAKAQTRIDSADMLQIQGEATFAPLGRAEKVEEYQEVSSPDSRQDGQ